METKEREIAEKNLAQFKDSIEIKDYGLALIRMANITKYLEEKVKAKSEFQKGCIKRSQKLEKQKDEAVRLLEEFTEADGNIELEKIYYKCIRFLKNNVRKQ